MMQLTYDDIDLFFYHAIDIDFYRMHSIIQNGILSQKAIIDKNIPFYYRNYTHSSTRNEYISISQFSRTFFHHYKLKNELYESSANKITFVINGYIEAKEKQHCKKKGVFTTEQHVYYEIKKEDIYGLVIRKIDAQKKIMDIGFNYKFTSIDYFENKVLSTINFYESVFGFFDSKNKFYYLIGNLRELIFLRKDTSELIKMISEEMRKSIYETLKIILDNENPTLEDAVVYFNNNELPIYIMNHYDIQPLGTELRSTDPRLGRIKIYKNLN